MLSLVPSDVLFTILAAIMPYRVSTSEAWGCEDQVVTKCQSKFIGLDITHSGPISSLAAFPSWLYMVEILRNYSYFFLEAIGCSNIIQRAVKQGTKFKLNMRVTAFIHVTNLFQE